MNDVLINSRKRRIVFTVVAFVTSLFVAYVLDPYSPYWKEFEKRSFYSKALEYLWNFALCFVISDVSIRLNNLMNIYLPWKERPGFRLLNETALNLFSITLVSSLFAFIYPYLYDQDPLSALMNLSQQDSKDKIQFLVANFFVSLMIMAFNSGIYLIENWKDEAVKASEMAQAATESELMALKLQIDPHFVFNNLSVLSEIILEDQQLGYEYAEKFTKVYRYMLMNSKKNIISLDEELKFLRAYIYLIKQRIGDAVNFELNVTTDSKAFYVPPLSLQLLVENALKHNKLSRSNPLVIKLFNLSSDELVVENSLRPIEKAIESSGIGLSNISRRYSLLGATAPVIINDAETFTVKISLIKYDHKNFNN